MEKEIRADYMAGETFVEPVKSDPEAEKRRIVDYFIRLRKEKGLTQQDLADTSGICRANAKGFEYLGRMKVSGDRHKEETRLNFVVPALCILPVAAVDSHVDLNIIGGAIVAVHTYFTPYTL